MARYAANRDLLLRGCPSSASTELAPADGAFYAYADIGHLAGDSQTWCTRGARPRPGWRCTPGVDFDTRDGNRYVRMSFAGSTAEVDEAVDRLAGFLGR